jgi:meiotically up-regulated gene 157 (Mug157) protein
MSQIIYALTAGDGRGSGVAIHRMLTMLQASAAGTGFMHESYNKNDIKKFTRPWFAWANSLFGELIVQLAHTRPELLR